MKILKKLLIFTPLGVTAILEIVSSAFANNGLVLRNTPSLVLFWLLIASIIIAFGGCIYFLCKWCKGKKKAGLRVIAGLISAALAAASVLLIFGSLFVSTFSYKPEHEVTKNGQNMIACVNSFLDVYVDYYEDKGPLFRGSEKLGEEWYGSGGYDPFTTDMEVAPKRSTFKD